MKKSLRFIGILFMGISAAVTLLGGVGTTCVALNAAAYDSMKAIANYQWQYIAYVLIGVALGVLGIRATIQLIRAKKDAEKSALIILAASIVIGEIHIITSRALRGSSMPVDGVVYINALTLIIFLLFQIPKIKELSLYDKETADDATASGGMTAFVAGLLVLSVQMWAGPTHLLDGINYADAFHNAMLGIGSFLVVFGLALISKALLYVPKREAVKADAYPPPKTLVINMDRRKYFGGLFYTPALLSVSLPIDQLVPVQDCDPSSLDINRPHSFQFFQRSGNHFANRSYAGSHIILSQTRWPLALQLCFGKVPQQTC